jgi:hypothetical protein
LVAEVVAPGGEDAGTKLNLIDAAATALANVGDCIAASKPSSKEMSSVMPENTLSARWDAKGAALVLVSALIVSFLALVSPVSPLAVGNADASTVGGTIGRSEVIARARDWYDKDLSYSQTTRHLAPDHNQSYRQDCSGFVSMTWHTSDTNGGYNTDSIPSIAGQIKFANLLPGDVLNSPQSKMGHVVLFEKWVSSAGGDFWMYEENGSLDMTHRTWSSSSYDNYSINKDGVSTSGTWTPRRYGHISSDGTTSNPNQSTPATLCGSGFYWIGMHDLGGATVYLLWNNSSSQNCVVNLQHNVDAYNTMNATLKVSASGAYASDLGSYQSYAGPVRLYAPGCVSWGGTWASTSWTSGWVHC